MHVTWSYHDILVTNICSWKKSPIDHKERLIRKWQKYSEIDVCCVEGFTRKTRDTHSTSRAILLKTVFPAKLVLQRKSRHTMMMTMMQTWHICDCFSRGRVSFHSSSVGRMFFEWLCLSLVLSMKWNEKNIKERVVDLFALKLIKFISEFTDGEAKDQF